jgi:hypothetical protein
MAYDHDGRYAVEFHSHLLDKGASDRSFLSAKAKEGGFDLLAYESKYSQ